MLNQGEISVAVLLDYSYTAAKSASEDYVWVDPSEGVYSGFNTLNIIKGCPNKELAEAFIDFYISKEVQLAEALDGVDSPVRIDVELTPEQAANFPYGKEMIDIRISTKSRTSKKDILSTRLPIAPAVIIDTAIFKIIKRSGINIKKATSKIRRIKVTAIKNG